MAATGIAVGGGIVLDGTVVATGQAAAALGGPMGQDLAAIEVQLAERRDTARVSRSDRRTDVDATKLRILTGEGESGGQIARSEDLGGGDPRTIAQAMLPEFGFSSSQFGCLDSLWMKESGWNPSADNPTSSAYGIPQALPGSKMASAGPDWMHNPATQIRWGLGYIRDRYGSPCAAWGHSQAVNWY